MAENKLYDYSPITERPKIVWPEGKKVAFYVGLNVEHFRVDVPGGSEAPASAVPDPLSYAQRDYGNRVGIWRIIELFDEVGLRSSAITNSEVCLHYPQIIRAGVERNWCWVGHGLTNSLPHQGYSEAEEAKLLDLIIEHFDSVGVTPNGWLGPAMTETFNTPRLLHARGFSYLLDWICDDRPFDLNIPGMVSVPYNATVNDIGFFRAGGVPGGAYVEAVLDQFEVLLEEGGGVVSLPVHPFVLGQPYRFKHLATVIREITSHEDVWVATSEDIANHFLEHYSTCAGGEPIDGR